MIERTFAATPASCGEARQFVAASLADVVTDEEIYDVKVATAEYATNAIRYAGGGKFTIAIELTSAFVTVHVIDAGEGTTAPKDRQEQAGHGSEGGRGRPLVAVMAEATGVETAAACAGTAAGVCCWFRFTRPQTGVGVDR